VLFAATSELAESLSAVAIPSLDTAKLLPQNCYFCTKIYAKDRSFLPISTILFYLHYIRSSDYIFISNNREDGVTIYIAIYNLLVCTDFLTIILYC
jgi:hypothetical protein